MYLHYLQRQQIHLVNIETPSSVTFPETLIQNAPQDFTPNEGGELNTVHTHTHDSITLLVSAELNFKIQPALNGFGS